jgi:hypothetical protein
VVTVSSLQYVVITATFGDAEDNLLSGRVLFTPNVTVYASGLMPVAQAGVPIVAQVINGQLVSSAGGPFQLLATDNDGLYLGGLSGMFFYTAAPYVSGQPLDSWEFQVPYAVYGNGPVDLYFLTGPQATAANYIDGGQSASAFNLNYDGGQALALAVADIDGGSAQRAYSGGGN